jgi:hypothetical protein
VVKIEVRCVMEAQVACSVDGFDLALREPKRASASAGGRHGGSTPMSRSTKLPASRKGCIQGVMLQGVILFKGGYAGVANAVTVDCQCSTVCLLSRR